CQYTKLAVSSYLNIAVVMSLQRLLPKLAVVILQAAAAASCKIIKSCSFSRATGDISTSSRMVGKYPSVTAMPSSSSIPTTARHSLIP
ncbi:hypothetical protein J6590_006277, partial [Homalodisca vitripennis]